MKFLLTTLSLAAIALASAPLHAATTDPMGGMIIDCPAGSDTAIGLPFTRPVYFEGRVDSVNGGQITVAGTPSWTDDQFLYVDDVQDNHYYVIFATGNKEGAWYTITDNDTTSVTVDLNPYGLAAPDSLADVATGGAETGDIVKIIPHWTPASLVGVDGPDGLEILLYSNSISGINLASSNSYVHFNSYGWYDGGTLVDDNIIFPSEALTIRNTSGQAFQLIIAGGVPMEAHRTIVRTIQNGTQQDNRIVFNSPIPEMIGNVDLDLEDGVELLVFNNDLAGLNKAPSNSLVYFDGYGWYDGGTRVDDPSDVPNQFFLQPGQSYILRKPADSQEDVVWTSVQSYLNQN